MCRLLATTGKFSPEQISSLLNQFQNLADCGCVPSGFSSGHRDGWGIVAYKQGKKVFLKKYPADASKDKRFKIATAQVAKKPNDLLVSHLRKISVGKVSVFNTQPFVFNGWSIAHNGTIYNSEKFPLAATFKKSVKGQTDTEKFFYYFLQNLKQAGHKVSPRDVLISSLKYVRKQYDYSAINLFLSDGKTLFVLREINQKNKFVKEKKLNSYYTLYQAKNSVGDLIFCSEKLIVPGASWKLLKNNTLVEVDIKTKKLTTYKVGK